MSQLPSTYTDLHRVGLADTRELVVVEQFALRPSSSSSIASPAWIKAADDPAARIAVVTLNDPANLNALSPALMLQLHYKLADLVRNPQIRAIILTGSGPGFCSGGSLDMIKSGAEMVHAGVHDFATPGGGTAEPWRFIRMQFGGVVRLIANSNVLFVAAVNGPAAGVGLALALACDCVLASKEHAVFVPAFAKLGLVPEVGTSWLLTKKFCF